MEKKDLRIIYMGTPDFAVESLRCLVEEGYNIVGVVTMPDKPAGRGHKIKFSPIKEYAIKQNLNLLQPKNLKDEKFVNELKELQADLQIVVAFRMLPKIVWDMPKMGTFNLHASLLPQYRGAAPINWAIINGEKETGITTFFLKEEIDTGEIIDRVSIPINEEDNVGTIHDSLMNLGAKLVIKTVDSILNSSIKSIPQNEFYKSKNELKSAPKIFKETCKINWNDETSKVHNLIRGLSPYPCAWSYFKPTDNKQISVKIFESEKELCECKHPAGTILTDNKSYLKVAAKNGYISIKSLQLSGKKRLDIKSFLNGYRESDLAKCSFN